MTYDVIIIGGGAAGLSAALSASGQGAKTLVLEAAPRVGRKILASGNGRCNLANMRSSPYPGNDAFAGRVLAQRPAEAVLSFFHALGLMTIEEEGGRVYPACGQAAAVLDVLRLQLERQRVPILTEAPAARIERTKAGYRVHTPQGAFEARALVAACGGMAGGKLGHDGSAYRLLTELGHTLVPPFPALCPLAAEKGAVKGLSGLRLPAILFLCRKKGGLYAAKPRDRDETLCSCQGEALFTDYGVSGICAMQLGRKAQEEHERTGAWPMLYLDFSPMLGLAPRQFGGVRSGLSALCHVRDVEALLRQREHILPLDALLTGLAPRLLSQRLRGQSIPELARSLAAFPVPLTGVRGMEAAQVTAGGLSVAEFDGGTLESRKLPGLFAAGEMLDVDGDCGGFNLMFAFASGLIAGENAARKAGKWDG